MDGLYINGKRPVSKKAVKAAVAQDPASVAIQYTSLFQGYAPTTGALPPATVDALTVGQRITFVGPDPYTARKFYGTITRVSADKWKVE